MYEPNGTPAPRHEMVDEVCGLVALALRSPEGRVRVTVDVHVDSCDELDAVTSWLELGYDDRRIGGDGRTFQRTFVHADRVKLSVLADAERVLTTAVAR